MRRIICSLVFVTLLIWSLLSPGVSIAGQAARPKAATKSDGASSITGRVVDEGGQPVADARIFVLPAGSFGDQGLSYASALNPITTDADGRFEVKDLSPRAYTVNAVVPGYITSGNLQQNYYRPGESVTISMVKGGVITGKVTNAMGEALVGVRVRAIRIKDSDNRPVRLDIAGLTSPAMSDSFEWEWMTDDRGVYRIYGLDPGIYLVAAGGRGLTPAARGGYDGEAPTYHPSGTADTAAEVTVRAGVEATNIDVRYRESRGLTVSGIITGSASNFAMVMIMRASTGLPESISFALPTSSGRSFIFDSIADGDYYLYALSMMGMGEGEASASKPKRIALRGADVTGIELSLVPLGSIAGRVVIEPAAKADCKPARAVSFQEMVLKALSDRREKLRGEPDSLLSIYSSVAPNDKGEFQIRYLDQGVKRLVIQALSEDLYIRSIALPSATPNAKPRDIAKDGLDIKSGDKVSGITVTLSQGAASLAGRVATPKDDSTPTSRLRVYLVPAEADAADNIPRYFETTLQTDGSFRFVSLAPGRYWVVVRPLMEEESVENAQRPLAWDGADRMGLRFEGEASTSVIELKQCERIADYSLIYKPPTKVKK